MPRGPTQNVSNINFVGLICCRRRWWKNNNLGTESKLNINLSFDLNKSIYTDPSLLADKHQLFKVLIAVNAILQITTGWGHF